MKGPTQQGLTDWVWEVRGSREGRHAGLSTRHLLMGKEGTVGLTGPEASQQGAEKVAVCELSKVEGGSRRDAFGNCPIKTAFQETRLLQRRDSGGSGAAESVARARTREHSGTRAQGDETASERLSKGRGLVGHERETVAPGSQGKVLPASAAALHARGACGEEIPSLDLTTRSLTVTWTRTARTGA